MDKWKAIQDSKLEDVLTSARETSVKYHGTTLQCFIPGRMMYMKEQGRYPTVSITGSSCALNCDHCNRKILETMIPARDPGTLIEICKKMADGKNIGVLISGGSREDGTLPWEKFIEAIKEIKSSTELRISVHTGFIDEKTALALKDAGVDEFLIDVIGNLETLRSVYHLDVPFEKMEESLAALEATGKPVIPHIVLGLNHGKIDGEINALEMITRYKPYLLVIVVLIPLRGSPMKDVIPPSSETVARFIALSRHVLPDVPISLSCARPAGKHRQETDVLAIEAGINRIAMPAEEALARARELGMKIVFFKTCCSKSY
jgi:uncharacterized radical SAM superfamily protein